MLSLETLLAYLPPERVEAVAADGELLRYIQGAALWADLSGFTRSPHKKGRTNWFYLFYVQVEMAGIEPASERFVRRKSTSVVD